jgi:Domain of unknown function (DUF4326)
MPTRIRLRRTRGWRKPEGAVVVSRPTVWANPFAVPPLTPLARARAVDQYERWLDAGTDPAAVHILDHIHLLTGRDLACWCPLDQPCHADVLLKRANDSLRPDP